MTNSEQDSLPEDFFEKYRYIGNKDGVEQWVLKDPPNHLRHDLEIKLKIPWEYRLKIYFRMLWRIGKKWKNYIFF